MVCPNCQTELNSNDLFCPECGTPVQPAASAAPVEPAAPVVQEAPAVPTVPAAPAPMPTEAPAQAKPKKKKAWLRWVLVGVWGALILAAAVVLFVLPALEDDGSARPVSVNKEEQWIYHNPVDGEIYALTFAYDTYTCTKLATGETLSGYYVQNGQAMTLYDFFDARELVWKYDADENGYWYTFDTTAGSFKIWIFQNPVGSTIELTNTNSLSYLYRADNGKAYVSADGVTTPPTVDVKPEISNEPHRLIRSMTEENARYLIEKFNWYIRTSLECDNVRELSASEKQQVRSYYHLNGAEYNNCRFYQSCTSHINPYFSEELCAIYGQYPEFCIQSNNDNSYYLADVSKNTPTFTPSGTLTKQKDGSYTLPLTSTRKTKDRYVATFKMVNNAYVLAEVELEYAEGELDPDTAFDLLDRAESANAWLLGYFDYELIDETKDTWKVTIDGSMQLSYPSVEGIDTVDQLHAALSERFTEKYIQSCGFLKTRPSENGGIYHGCFIERNGTLYFDYNWGMGWYGSNRASLSIQKIDDNTYHVSAGPDDPGHSMIEWDSKSYGYYVIVKENGAYKVDKFVEK